ncbi:hypothetical protein POM88_025646 [Heracleum sosnowskyi]|uniref:RING-type E3 ubiquitin transferase n=1 Tax=Heracleum sosnowskyi TaxID=360622 RepID=A0AAD8MN44_9APIA|nr:hypothetical protein POM88_025646 [Heracleum sosnowskyi]
MVLLLGACPEYGCLVYEYLSNGSLEDRLQRGNSKPLSWQHRFRIAAEIRTWLLFLHQTKPGNILLDHNFVSKISDVGLARLVPPTIAGLSGKQRNRETYHLEEQPISGSLNAAINSGSWSNSCIQDKMEEPARDGETEPMAKNSNLEVRVDAIVLNLSENCRQIDESDAYQNGSIRSDHTVLKMKERGTATSRAQPAASRESFAQVMENGRTDGNGDNFSEYDAVIYSKSSSQSKRSRKASAIMRRFRHSAHANSLLDGQGTSRSKRVQKLLSILDEKEDPTKRQNKRRKVEISAPDDNKTLELRRNVEPEIQNTLV